MPPPHALTLPHLTSPWVATSFAARNLTEEEKKGHKELKWDDPDVCGPYMVRFCPHDLFINTKSNLGTAAPLFPLRFAVDFVLLTISSVVVFAGTCLRIHDPKLKER
jgi:hypothetical protein